MNPLEAILKGRLPLIQAPMAGVQGSALAIAVSEAGGLGSLPCAMLSPEQLVAEVEAIRAATDQPYNLNFFCHTMPEPDAARQQHWLDTLAPYYRELGLALVPPPPGVVRRPFSAEIADLIEPFRPPVVSFHFGLPEPALVERIKSWGSAIIASATTVDEALWLQARGADGVIAQGVEAGGHRGMFLNDDLTTQVGTLALVAQLVDRLDIPVIAAGGVADAKGVQAVRALGAVAAQVGTAYLLCPEVGTGPLHRAALKSEGARHTALTNLFSGRPARGIVNRVMREQGYLSNDVPAFPYAAGEVGVLRSAAEARGSSDFTPLWCGQNPSGCRELPAAELTRMLCRESD